MLPRILTGITTTGIPHLGNYVGAIRPAIQASAENDNAFFFLADYHGIIKCHQAKEIHHSTLCIAATWLACGLDYERVTFYRQSDIPEILELAWVLNCVCAKGLMNRAHAYKAAVDANTAEGKTDADEGVSMGLFGYPVLMAADILAFNANAVPVGRDQIQHVEMARDIAGRFNHRYAPLFVLPEAKVSDEVALLTGLDGRKMSKSYGNTIALFDEPKKLRKQIMKIVTNSQAPGEPKNPDESTIFEIYKAFASKTQQAEMREKYAQGIAWGEAKQALFELINEEIEPFRARYEQLMANPAEVEEILQIGAKKARAEAQRMMAQVREAIGIQRLG